MEDYVGFSYYVCWHHYEFNYSIQGCDLIEFADEHNIMFHQCEICTDEYEEMIIREEFKKQLNWDYRAHEDIRE